MNKPTYLVVKWVAVGLAVATAFWLATTLAAAGYVIPTVVAGLIGIGILALYGTKKAIPLKYLAPGMLLLIAFQLWPIIFTAGVAFTNYGDGHLISKEETITDIIAQSVREVEGSERYTMSVGVPEGASKVTGELNLLLTKADGTFVVGNKSGLQPLEPAGVTAGTTGKITAAPGFTILNAREVNARSEELQTLAVPTGTGGGIKPSGLSEAFEGKASVSYDAATDRLTDTSTEPARVFAPVDAQWVNEADPNDAFPQGWRENVGVRNFTAIFTDETLRAGFLKIFVWNLVFAVVSVLSTFILGMLLALLFNDPKLKGKAIYRSILVLPYALPIFVTALVWQGMFNQEFGLINKTLGLSIDWLGTEFGAKAAILITNLWLGFPYMFIVCTGALQSIPSDVKEAAKIDGANAVRTLRSIIMPLLLVAVGPLLIASFAFNFNNFSLVYLLTKGGPFDGEDTSIGSSDLLITYAYRLAFTGSAPNFGFAAAVSVVIFILVALMSLPGFRSTKALEEVN